MNSYMIGDFVSKPTKYVHVCRESAITQYRLSYICMVSPVL
jgi:hypothetical protein